MTKTKRIWLLAAIIAWWVLVIAAMLWRNSATVPGASRMLSTGVPTVYGGQAQSWALASTAIPPARATTDPLYPGNQVLSFDCYAYLENVYTSDGGYTWTDLDACITAAAGRTVKLPDGTERSQLVVLTLPPAYLESGGAGSSGDPFTTKHIPAWMDNGTYTTTFTTSVGGSTYYYNALKYQALQAKMTAFLTAAGARYNTNANVGLVRVYVGFEGESQPNKAQAGEGTDYFLGRAETVSTCTQYKAYVQALAEAAYAAFTAKPVVAMIGTQPCASYNPDRYRKELFGDTWAPAGKVIGISLNSLMPDRADAATLSGLSYYGWYKLQALQTVSDQGAPVYAEYGESATGGSVGSTDKGQYMLWSMLAGAANGADWVANNNTWIPYYGPYMHEVADWWVLSDRRAWVVFRDREWPGYSYSSGWGSSGLAGDFTTNANYLNAADAPQACNASVRATAVVANAAVAVYNPTPACASTALPTPAPTATADAMTNAFNRQARRLVQYKTIDVALDSTDWATYYGTSRAVTVTTSYLDWGTDTFAVSVLGLGGVTTSRTVTKTNTGMWLRDVWPVSSLLTNSISTAYGNAYARISNPDSGVEYIHELYVDAGSDPELTPTPTLTATAGPTPTATITATATITPTATATPSGEAWFTEVMPLPGAGAACDNWNLRSGCGADDTFVELRTSAAMSLAGYRLVAGTCSYTFPTDATNSGYVVVFADDMRLASGLRCPIVPAPGTLYLYTSGGAVVAEQAYSQPDAGYSWADPDPETAGGTWAQATASPGED